jgi:hypothetical protein
MKDIKKSLYLYAGIFILMMIATLLLLAAGADSFNRLWFLLPLSASALAAVLVIREYSRLKTAKIIIENKILYIQPMAIGDLGWDNRGSGRIDHDLGKDTAGLPAESIEVFVSCFGILLGSKIIKFNQEGIQLKAVEIGRHYLFIDYGTGMDIRNIRLLYARPDSDVLAGIIEKFRYETGIVPAVTQ